MNKSNVLTLGHKLEEVLRDHFTDKAYTVVAQSQPVEVDNPITFSLLKASKSRDDSAVINLDYEVRSEDPSRVFAGFNLARQGDRVARNSLANLIMDFFNVDKFVNMGANIRPQETYVWFVVQGGSKYYFHIRIYPKFGAE